MNRKAETEPFDSRPDWRSWTAVLILLGEILIEGIKLPFRLVVYLSRRKAVTRALRQMLERPDSA